MARTQGSRNADYERERARLAGAVLERLMLTDGASASLRSLAAGADVSVATMKHYFESREGAIRAALETLRERAAQHLMGLATADRGPVEQALRSSLRGIVLAWQNFGLGRAHAFGLAAGVQSDELGPAYVQNVLEPTLVALEARLALHVASGELDRCDLRTAALMLASPLVLGLLHQGELGGARCRPLALEPFVDELVTRFLRAYAPAGGARAG